MHVADETIAARKGDELPGELEGYLRERLGAKGDYSVRQFPGGYSNLSYRVCFGGETFVLRRPPRGAKAKSAHDMGREFRVLSLLHPHFPQCPKPLLYCEDESLLGASFYVMSHIAGLILRKELPKDLGLSESELRRQHQATVRLQFDLHQLDYQALGLAELGHPEAYVQRQIQGWAKRYRAARTEDAPDCEELMSWFESQLSLLPSQKPGLIHNDFKLDNIVFDAEEPTKIVGVLDWEMATIGDPLMDLGNSLAYWVEPSDHPSMQAMRTLPSLTPGYLSRREQLATYESLSGRAVERWDFYYAWGLFRLLVIAQQIYQRYKTGFSTDERFAQMILGVRALEKQVQRVIAGKAL